MPLRPLWLGHALSALAVALMGYTVYRIHRMEKRVEAKIALLTEAVEKSTSVAQSAITLIKGLAAQIEASKDDPEQLQALADKLNAESAELAAAVEANTPGA